MTSPVAARLLLLVSLATPGATAAQADGGTPLVTGHAFSIPSRVLGETRTVEVALPPGYDANADRRYPVLYVLDGEFEGPVAATITRFYGATGQLPAMIVVAVRNTARTRDLTPPAAPGFAPPREAGAAGGGDRFLQFLADELIPWVDRGYRTNPLRVLVGHSLGGLLALHAVAARPRLFTGYIVMEPATWWNNGREVSAAVAALRLPAARPTRLALVNVEPMGLDTTGTGDDAPLIRHLRVRGESHAGMAMAGMMQGLRTLFADFQPPRWVPGTRPIAMLEHYAVLSRRLGFEVPIPAQVLEQVFLMSVHARHFDDAARILERLDEGRPADGTRDLREMLATERATPAPAGLVPLTIPATRPSPRDAAKFLGRWALRDGPGGHEVEIRASGDTIAIYERERMSNGEWWEDDAPVITVTPSGELEWGQRVFRGIAALLVLRARVLEDGTMTVTREVRGWIPRGPAGDMLRTERFRRVG